MIYNRTIKFALELISGEIIDADEDFKIQKEAFEFRKKAHKGEIQFRCLECEQRLNISTSKCDRMHFKHEPNADFCILKDVDFNEKETEELSKFLKSKESPRHKYLKNLIAERLRTVEGIDLSAIHIDDKFIYRGNDKRRPDVYCKHLENELVFEIQLSQLPLKYILKRYDFYGKNKIYLIWILDEFDILGQSQLERDIKYLNEFQNFFKLDETVQEFRLICDYKYPFLTASNEVHSKWHRKSVSLDELNFSEQYYQVYFFNFNEHKSKMELKQQIAQDRTEETNRKRQLEEKAKLNVVYFEDRVKDILRRQKESSDPGARKELEWEINQLDALEIEVLNKKWNEYINPNSLKPFVNHLIHKKAEYWFIEMILDSVKIDLNVNLTDYFDITAFQEVIESNHLSHSRVIKCLFKNNYCLTDSDLSYIRGREISKKEKEVLMLRVKAYDKLRGKVLINQVEKLIMVLCTIESAKQGRIIGFKYDNWIAFANNAIEGYKENWTYIEHALKKFDLLDKIFRLDKKKTFQKKLKQFHIDKPKQILSSYKIMIELYPEVFSDYIEEFEIRN